MNGELLKNLSITDFMARTSGIDPVPGGGSVSALCGALAAALAEMVTGLTIGRKKYVDAEAEMREIAPRMADAKDAFLDFIDKDAAAYDEVFSAFKMPKETDDEKAARARAIQEATLKAALVPLEVAKRSVAIMDDIRSVALRGNQNAVTDACVAMMCARTACFGAILNVMINLQGLDDKDEAARLTAECAALRSTAAEKEVTLLTHVNLLP
ncbi:MAG: cyclodeaminase/cyclohydrolase family protein [Muribaculaceae bacterium]|nr:cyclodeaminase/cyclohydrolase family protein [Muribaculaceae bacterium]